MRLLRALLLAVVVAAVGVSAACTPKAAEASVSVMAVGDSAKIFASWPAVNRATSYTYTISVVTSNGTWTNLPSAVSTAALSVNALGISSTADTAVFQVCVTAVGVTSSNPGCSTSVSTAANTWHRKLTAPVPHVDSISLVPGAFNLYLAQSRVLCGFQGFHDGQMAERTSDKPVCDSIYIRAFTVAHRQPTSAEQTYADTATWQWTSNNPAAIGLLPHSFGSSAVLVTGNSLTMRMQPVPIESYALLQHSGR